MFIRMTCESCGIRFKVNVKNAGKRGRCPREECSQSFIVPVPKIEKVTPLPPSKIVEKSDGVLGKLVLSEAELDRLSDEISDKLNWTDDELISQDEIVENGLVGEKKSLRADQKNWPEESSAFLQPCGVMPLEAIEFLRDQKKLGTKKKTGKRNLKNRSGDRERNRISSLPEAVPDAEVSKQPEENSDSVSRGNYVHRTGRRILQRSSAILSGTALLLIIAGSYFFFHQEGQTEFISPSSLVQASEVGFPESEVPVPVKKKKRKIFPDVPPPPVLMEASLEEVEEEYDPDAIAVVLLDSTEEISETGKLKQDPASEYHQKILPLVNQYCSDCHSGDEAEGGINFDELKAIPTSQNERKSWKKILAMLEAKAMPPEDYEPKPTHKELDGMADWIADEYFNLNCDEIDDPGRVTIRRLNRVEYSNTIRDLVGINLKLTKDFPSDEVGEGFDNIGDVLSLPPLLMEKYLRASQMIVDEVIVNDPKDLLAPKRYTSKELRATSSMQRIIQDFRVLVTNHEVFVESSFPWDGTYVIRVEALGDQAGPDKVRMGIRVDGKQVNEHTIEEHKKWKVFETKVTVGKSKKLSKGKHRISAAFLNDYFNAKAKGTENRDRNMAVRYIEIEGPLEGADVSYPESHRRIVIAEPGKGISALKCFQTNLVKFAERAYRRPVTEEELKPIIKLALLAYEDGEPFGASMKIGLQAILVSPHFLFRVEKDHRPDDPETSRDLTHYEMASRLSYFLWSSMPDEELFRLAHEKKLNDPAVLRQQVMRMLADRKSKSIVDNFGGQWLNLRSLDNAAPDFRKFAEYNKKLKNAMRRETDLLFIEIMKKDRSILEFLTADYTFLNEQLANHYGIKGVKGKKFRRVDLKGEKRRGILTHASILTLTSAPKRTVPVKRGKWIMENILGTPPPPPPPGVPELDVSRKKNPMASIRAQMEVHRANPACASCHLLMDPLGMGFENYDPIGRWRDKDNDLPVDASGELPGGEKFNNALELISLLEANKKEFATHLTRQLLTYSLGRGLLYYDECAIDKIVASMEDKDYRFSELVSGIVLSRPFMKRRGDGGRE